ncbi:MAG TPA: hypothetical protein VJ840_10165 [Gemmatimonadaceae bacterium]|nr:hypothetical protein [Gemmatimonadaceae bacterium]
MSRLTFSTALLLAVSTPAIAQQAGFASADSGPANDVIFETKDAAVATAGLRPLAKSDLRKGEREVRIWYSGFGNPQYLVIIRQNGANVSGRLMLWWDQYYEGSPSAADARVDNFVRKGYDCGPISKRDSQFGEDRWISSVCQANLKGSPDWKAFLSEVEAHALPQSTAANADAPNDGETWGITVERRSGTIYGVSHYKTALSFGAPEPGRGPKLQDMIQALAAMARKEPVVAQH